MHAPPPLESSRPSILCPMDLSKKLADDVSGIHYALTEALKTNFLRFKMLMCQCRFISEHVRDREDMTSNQVMHDFKQSLRLKTDYTALQESCTKFLSILQELGPPASDLVGPLRDQWNQTAWKFGPYKESGFLSLPHQEETGTRPAHEGEVTRSSFNGKYYGKALKLSKHMHVLHVHAYVMLCVDYAFRMYHFKLEPLKTTHLNDVETALKNGHFSSEKYEDLGLELGLYYDTLAKIEANNPRDVDKCLRKCLVKWFERVDGVSNKGEPSWRSLARALEVIGQKPTADYIKSMTNSDN